MKLSDAVNYVHAIDATCTDWRGRVYSLRSPAMRHGFNRESATIFHGVLASRGNKRLLFAYCYGKTLTVAEKDELLICSRITKAKLGK